MKSRLDIIKETVKYYSEDTSRRGFNKKQEVCVYYDKDTGCKCAVGRYVKDSYLDDLGEFEGNYENVLYEGYNPTEFFDKRKVSKEIALDEEFWSDLQKFHDNSRNFNITKGSRLNVKGDQSVEELIKIYG